MDKNKFINSLKKSVLRVMPGGQALSALAGRRTQTPQALPMQNTQKNIAPNIPATNFNTPKVQNSPMVNRTNSSNTPVSNSGVGSSQSNPKTDYMNNVYKPMATGAGMTTPTTTTGSVDAKPVKKEQSAYIEYLKSMFNPEQVKMAQKNIFDLNERIAKENKRVRDEEERIRKNEFGQFEGGINAELGELGRVSGRTLSDLTGAKSVATDIYNQMIEAGATVFEAEQAAQKAEREANQREAFNLSEGQARYDYNPETGQYEMIAQRGKTFAPSSGGTGGTGESPDRMTQYSASKAQNILGFIDQAIDQAGSGAVTGLAGATLGGIPGTQAFNLKRTIDTIKANIGFQELQAMRAASPTGGALGQVAVQELDALQSTLGSLNTSQSRNQLIANLEKIKQHYNNWLSTVNTGTTTAMTPTSNILVSPDGQSFDASDLTPEELQQALADGFKLQ